jgi:hypothetical protein
MSEEAPQWFKDYMKNGSAPPSGATIGGTTTASKTDSSMIDKALNATGKLAEAVAPATIGLVKLATGASAAEIGLNGLTKGLETVGLGAFAGVVGMLGKSMLEVKGNMDLASKELGIGANNIGAFVRMSGEAGLTTQQFSETIKKSDGLMSGLAGSANRGAEAFSKVQKTLIESDMGRTLADIGISGQELAEMTALSMSNNTKLNLKSAAGQEEAAKKAGELATELDATAKVSGQSREALMKTLKAEEQKPNVILMEMQMSKDQLAGYQNLKTQMAGFGPAFQGLSAEIASGGVRTKEGLAQMAALGPAGIEFEKATKMMTNAKSDEEKKNAQAALERAQAAINQRMASKEYNDMMQYGTAEQKAAIAAQVGNGANLKAAAKNAEEAGGSFLEGAKKAKRESAAVQQGKKVDADGNPILDEKGKAVTDEGAQTAQLLNQANRQATIQAGAMASKFEDINKEIGSNSAFRKALGLTGNAQNMGEAKEGINKLPAEAFKAVGITTDKTVAPEKGGSGGKNNRKVEKVEADPKTTREGGTLEKTGSPTEPADVIAKIHKGETVFSPDAVKNMGIKMSEMSKMVSTTVSSATGSAEAPTPKIADSTTAVFDKSIDLFKARLEKAVESGNAARIALETKGLERNQQALAAYTQEQLEKREGIEKLGYDAYYAKLNQAKTKEAEAKIMSADELIALDKANVDKSKEVKKEEAGVSKQALEKLAAEISSGGVRTMEGLKTMAAMGVEGRKFEKQVLESKAEAKEKSASGGLFDMLNPTIINQKAADLQKAATSQTAPKTTEAVPKNAEAEAKKKEDEAKAKAKAEADAKQTAAPAPKPAAGGGDATMKDLKDQLVTLNKNMLQLISHSEATADAAHKTAKSTAKATGAR